jgi:hypothetical protein
MSHHNEKDWSKVIGVFSKATTRMQRGAATYGEYDPATDTRDLYQEAQEELLDAMNYLAMEYLRLERLKNSR